MALDPEIHAVVAELERLGGSFVAGSTAEEARHRPVVADAVRSLLWAEGTSLAPEPVGARGLAGTSGAGTPEGGGGQHGFLVPLRIREARCQGPGHHRRAARPSPTLRT